MSSFNRRSSEGYIPPLPNPPVIPSEAKKPISVPKIQLSRYVPFFGVVDITTAATRQMLITGANQELMQVKTITIKAFAANNGLVYLGVNDVSGTADRFNLSPGDSISYSVEDDPEHKRYIDVTKFWVDTATSGNDVCYTGLREAK